MTKTRIMYIEYKGEGITGPGRIGRVSFSKTGKTLHYGGREYRSLHGSGYKANYFDVDTGEHYWISGCRKDGNDALYPDVIDIDADVATEYWLEIRGMPDRVGQLQVCAHGKHSRGGRNTK